MVAYNLRDGGLVAKLYPTFATPWTVACQALCPWDSLGKNTGVGCHFLLQGILPTLGSSPRLQMRQIFVNTNFKALAWCPKECRQMPRIGKGWKKEFL